MAGQRGIALDGARLKHLRRNQAFTQVALAERAGVFIDTYRRAEKGFPISLRVWRGIAEALGVDTTELLPAGVEA